MDNNFARKLNEWSIKIAVLWQTEQTMCEVYLVLINSPDKDAGRKV